MAGETDDNNEAQTSSGTGQHIDNILVVSCLLVFELMIYDKISTDIFEGTRFHKTSAEPPV